MIFSGPESEKKTQLPFKTSKTILNKIKIAMIHWTGNEAITYICKTVMHLYFDFLCWMSRDCLWYIIVIHQHPKTLFSTSFWCEALKYDCKIWVSEVKFLPFWTLIAEVQWRRMTFLRLNHDFSLDYGYIVTPRNCSSYFRASVKTFNQVIPLYD